APRPTPSPRSSTSACGHAASGGTARPRSPLLALQLTMPPVWLTDTVTPDLDRALHYTLLWGLEGVVLRAVGIHDDREPHVNEAKLQRRLAEHDVPAVAVDPGLFEGPAGDRGAWMNDLALLPDVLAFCRRIGCGTVLVGALSGDEGLAVEALRRAA